ncbi:hypothetical protein [Streptomyces sp. NBC_01497]|uniref:hypothetical protein n=1 Tax=Streptomyces sp. NBC_01497 TaxID=2903885 RepID=UPI002E2F9A1D|nr:hypothetical protein [Streptomyces sp. NBC_01497]
MYGAVQPPPARTRAARAGVVAVRVLLTACAPLTIGLLACAPLFRIAVLRRRWWDWTLAWAAFPVACGLFSVVGTLPEDAVGTNVSMCSLLLIGVASAVYFLVFDLRRDQRPKVAGPGAYGPVPGYGYPPYTTAPMTPGSPVPHGAPYAPPPGAPAFGPPSFPSAPRPAPPTAPPPHGFGSPLAPAGARGAVPGPAHTPRIDQVRAELDELSDLLRKDSGKDRGTDRGPDQGLGEGKDQGLR